MDYEQVLLFLSYLPENPEKLTAYTMLIFERRFLLHLETLPA